MNREEEIKQIFSGRYPLPLDATTKKSYKIELLRSTVSYGLISEISLPEIPGNCNVFSYQDLPDNNIVIDNEIIPILAEKSVSYVGQPILIITGPDSEEIKTLRKRIKITYEVKKNKNEIVYSKKIENSPIDREYKTVSGCIKTSDNVISKKYLNGVFVKKDSDCLIIYCYNNWSNILLQNLSRILKIPGKKIKIITPFIQIDPDISIFDNLYSSIIAGISQTLIKKNVTFDPSQSEKKRFSSKYYGLKADWAMHFNRDNELTGTNIKVEMDCGAYPILMQEKVYRILFGLTSFYRIKDINLEVVAKTSNRPPCGIFSGLYLPDANIICEAFISKLISTLDKNQYNFRLSNILDKGFKSNTNSIIKKELPLKKMLEEIVEVSDFLRKDSSIGLSNKRKESVLKLLPKKGVGLSLGYNGNNYISNNKTLMMNSVTVNLLQGDIVEIILNTTVNSIEYIDIWKNIVKDILDIPHENITIETNDLSHEQSPFIENKNVNIITPLIKQCCDDIKGRRFKDPLPIKQTRFTRRASIRTWDPEKWVGNPFKTTSYGASVVEVEIDKRALEPIIKEIWLIIDVGNIIDKSVLLKAIYRDIYKTITNLMDSSKNIPYFTRKSNQNPQINISFYDSGRKKESKALGSLIASTLTSSYLQGVNQALGSNFNSLPITREMISKELLKDAI